METIGERIAIQRLNKRWTQEKLAYELGIKQSVLSDIENDKISPKWDMLGDIAQKLEIPLTSLLPVDTFNIMNNNHNNNVGGIINNNPNIEEERKLWEKTLQAKEDLIESQKILIEALKAGVLKV